MSRSVKTLAVAREHKPERERRTRRRSAATTQILERIPQRRDLLLERLWLLRRVGAGAGVALRPGIRNPLTQSLQSRLERDQTAKPSFQRILDLHGRRRARTGAAHRERSQRFLDRTFVPART